MAATKADLTNWMQSPHNRYAFSHLDEILPTASISKSDTTSDLPEAHQKFDADAFNLEYNGTKLDFQSFISQTHSDGLMILKNGEVVFEDYYNGNTKDSKHIVMSITKSITGLLVGIMQARGKLSVNDLVSKFVPEISGTFYKDKTIQQCIDMRTGALYVDGTHEYRAAAGWHPPNGTEKSKNLKDFLANFHPELTDDRFSYVSPNVDLMGWVLERASGMTFAELVQDALWQPLGAESDAMVGLDSEGLARAAGGLCVTLRDLARVAQLFVDDGKNTLGKTVVPADWIQDILHGGSRDAWQRGAYAGMFQSKAIAYRAYCYVDQESETVMGFGVYGQHFAVDRKSGVVLVATRSQETGLEADKIRMTLDAFREINRVLGAA